MTSPRLAALAFGLTLSALASPAAADIKTACEVAPSFDEALAQLLTDGWEAQERRAQFTPEQTEALAWTLMVPYLAGGDDGGESQETLLELQRAAVPGLLLRRDTDTTKSRVLLKGDDAFTIVQTRTLPGRVERVCRVALAEAQDGLELIDAEDGAPNLSQIITILPEVK